MHTFTASSDPAPHPVPAERAEVAALRQVLLDACRRALDPDLHHVMAIRLHRSITSIHRTLRAIAADLGRRPSPAACTTVPRSAAAAAGGRTRGPARQPVGLAIRTEMPDKPMHQHAARLAAAADADVATDPVVRNPMHQRTETGSQAQRGTIRSGGHGSENPGGGKRSADRLPSPRHDPMHLSAGR